MLTQEYVEGHPFSWLVEQPEETRQRASEVLYRWVFGTIARFRAFNGDPHPGNYLFHEDGAVTFLDFGCTKYFSAPMVLEWKGLLVAHIDGNLERFREQLVKLRFIPEDTDADLEKIYEYFGFFYEPFRSDRVFTFTPGYTARTIGLVFDREHPEFGDLVSKFNMPADFAFVNRIQWGVYSILSQLGASGTWHRIHREYYVGDEPSSELGHASADFRAAWKRERDIPADAGVWLEPDGIRWGSPAPTGR